MNIFLENKMLESMFLFEQDGDIEQKLLSSELIKELQAQCGNKVDFNVYGGNCTKVVNAILAMYPNQGIEGIDELVLYPWDKTTNAVAGPPYTTGGLHTVIKFKDKLYDYTNQQYAEPNSDTYPESLKNKIPVIFTKISENKYSSEQQQDENENIVLIIETK